MGLIKITIMVWAVYYIFRHLVTLHVKANPFRYLQITSKLLSKNNTPWYMYVVGALKLLGLFLSLASLFWVIFVYL